MSNQQDMEIASHDEQMIDESLYSRQLYVFGHEAQKRMAKSDVLILGMNGLGVEIAKNVILSGVKSVTLHDDVPTSLNDLSSQFYLSEDVLGTPRARATQSKLAELNPYVHVALLEGEITPEQLKNYAVVVALETSLDLQLVYSTFCHENGICFIAADTFGVFGNVFCDFGSQFVVNDTTGEPAEASIIASMTLLDPANTDGAPKVLVNVLEEGPHGLYSGDTVIMTHIQCETSLNGAPVQVTVKDRFSFEISLEEHSWPLPVGTQYLRGGYITQVKQPAIIDFEPLANKLDTPGYIMSLITKEGDHAAALHLGFRALHEFKKTRSSLPEAGNLQDAEEVYSLATALNSRISLVQNLESFEKLIKQLSLTSRGVLNPICALLGGIVAQEVIKACSGKFMPIKQWFYYDCAEALPDEPLSMEEVAPLGCRYDSQIAVFGQSIQSQLANLNMFLVGAGAIGCEMLKNWGMMGVSCSFHGQSGGTIHVTDMDSIEKSNLSRQFLFRSTDITHPKSVVAARAAKTMNPNLNLAVYETKAAPETENIFDDDFYESLSMVCTALDNIQARLYIDQRCMFYHLPMLESGTLGTKGSTQVVVPCVTENYGASRDPVEERSIPICTLKFYPNLIEHTLQWGRELFEEYFKQTPDDCNNYLNSSSAEEFQANYLANQQNMKLDTLNRVHNALVKDRPQNVEDCIRWARFLFEELFSNNIKQLLHNFPADKLTSTGVPFWSGSKKPPTPLEFSIEDPLHLTFISSVANLRAQMFNISTDRYNEIMKFTLENTHVPPFVPSDGVKIPSSDEESKNQNATPTTSSFSLDDIDERCRSILRMLPPTHSSNSLKSIEFDKDIDSHMIVVAALGNLRARNYNIPEADLHRARGIAGKIIPAIATTTAMVTGFICMEIFKILYKKPITSLLNTSCNLALPAFLCNEPQPPEQRKAIINGTEYHWNQWDRIDIQDTNMTLNALIEYLRNNYNVQLIMLSYGVTILYSDYMNKKKMEERKEMPIQEIIIQITKKEFNPKQKYIILEMITNDIESDEEVELPYLRFRLFK